MQNIDRKVAGHLTSGRALLLLPVPNRSLRFFLLSSSAASAGASAMLRFRLFKSVDSASPFDGDECLNGSVPKRLERASREFSFLLLSSCLGCSIRPNRASRALSFSGSCRGDGRAGRLVGKRMTKDERE